MGHARAKEARRHQRLAVSKFPGVILNPETQEVISCEPVDVSASGLGIVSPEWVLPQVDLLFVVGNRKIAMEIVWGVERRAVPNWAQKNGDAIPQQTFRYGLKLASTETCDLTAIFKKEGCLD